jgi:predicted alpha/beta superfamily hydrolase
MRLQAQEATTKASTATAQVSTFMIDAPQLGGQKKIWIYVPKEYAATKKKYPVLYMHDAQNVFDNKTAFAGEWHVDETLDSLNAQVIVVAIEHGNEKRIDELTPYSHEKYGGGKADTYLDFIVKKLKPEIDKRYRTKSNAKNTGIMGSSLGGLVSFYAALKYPEVFGKAGIFSPSFWFSKDIYTLAEKSDKIKTKMYFLCGDHESEEMVPDMEKMIKLVVIKQDRNTDLIKETVVPGGEHNEKLWGRSFAKAFTWLYNN